MKKKGRKGEGEMGRIMSNISLRPDSYRDSAPTLRHSAVKVKNAKCKMQNQIMP